MRALVFDGPREIVVSEHPDPAIVDPDDAIVRVEAAGLCGSDLHPYSARERAAPGVVTGHEAVGEVVEAGASVRGVGIGDRVIVPFTTSCGRCAACLAGLSARCEVGRLFGWGDLYHLDRRLDGCQAELVRVPLASSTLVPCPAVSASHAVLLSDNLPTALVAIERARHESGTLAIVGLGSVGLCAIAIARASGIEDIVAFDPIATRAVVAESLGARIVSEVDVDQVGASSVVEAAGTASALRTSLAMARAGATISIISVQTERSFAITPVEAYDENLVLALGRASVKSTLDAHIERLTAMGDDVVDVIVDRPGLPLSEGPRAYEAFADRQFVKATFDPSDARRESREDFT